MPTGKNLEELSYLIGLVFLGDMFVLEELTFTGSNAQKLYLKKCADFQITPCSHFVKSLSSKEIDMEHHNVGPKGAVACAFALTVRRCICPAGT